MKKNFKKYFLLSFLLISIFFNSKVDASILAGDIIKDSQELASGVLYQNIEKLTSDGWVNINLVRIDMTNESADIGAIFSKDGISKLETTSNLVDSNDAIAGINGGFFNWSPIAHPVGGLISHGEMISSPTEIEYAWPGFLIDSKNKAEALLLDRKLIASNKSGKYPMKIEMVNKAKTKDEFKNISILYSHNWGKYSPGNKFSNDTIELVVENDRVVEIRENKGPVKLTENQYVLHTRGTYNKQIKRFKLNSEMKIDLDTVPDLENIKLFIAGNSQILKDGVAVNTHNNQAGKHPRTGIGVSKDNKELIIATVDGRNSAYTGVEQKTFGAILESFGMYNAINLDGGGSTTMAIKKAGDKNSTVVNYPSDGSERKVSNGVGIFNKGKKGELAHIKILCQDTNVFKGSSRKIDVRAYDSYLNEISLDKNKLNLAIDKLDADIGADYFRPKESGRTKIRAEYLGKKASLDINVLDSVKSIEKPFKELKMSKNDIRYIENLVGVDGNGLKASLHPDDINFEIADNKVCKIQNRYLNSFDIDGLTPIILTRDEAKTSFMLYVGDKDYDENKKSIMLTQYPKSIETDLSTSDEAVFGEESLALTYDFSKPAKTRNVYLSFYDKNKRSIAIDKDSLSLNIKGDNNKEALTLSLRNKDGKVKNVVLTKRLDFTGWKEFNVKLTDGYNYLDSLYISELNESRTYNGKLLIDIDGIESNLSRHFNLPIDREAYDEKNIDRQYQDYTSKISLSYGGSNYMKAIKNSHVNLFLNPIDNSLKNKLNSDLILESEGKYVNTRDFKDVLYLNINSKKGGITKHNAKQWDYIRSAIKKSKSNNIIMMLPTKVFGKDGFTDKKEALILHQLLLDELNKGKNVYVIEGSDSFKVKLKDGIRYIEMNKSKKNSNYIEFYGDKNNLTYQFFK